MFKFYILSTKKHLKIKKDGVKIKEYSNLKVDFKIIMKVIFPIGSWHKFMITLKSNLFIVLEYNAGNGIKIL